MIFTGFKRKTSQIFFNKLLVKSLNSSKIQQKSKIKKALIFLNSEEEIHGVKKELSKLLNIKEIDVDVLIFQSKKQKKNSIQELFSPQDFGWYGKIKSAHLKTILTNKYDLLINREKIENIYSKILILRCEEAFKVGFANLDTRLYDLLIDCNAEDEQTFHKELVKYLAILNKIE